MYGKNTIRHSLTADSPLSHRTSGYDIRRYMVLRQPPGTHTGASAPAHWLHPARPLPAGIKKYTFWIHLEIGKDNQRKKKYFYWLLANFIVILKMLSKKKNRPKSVLFGLFFVQPVKHRIVHVHNVTQADRISVCPFSIYDTLLTRIILCGV